MADNWQQRILENYEALAVAIDYDLGFEASLDAFKEFQTFVDVMREMKDEPPISKTQMLLDFVRTGSDRLFEILCHCLNTNCKRHIVSTYLKHR